MSRAAPRWRDLRWSTRLCVLGTLLGLTLLLGEMLARGYWCIARQVPVFGTQRIGAVFFPELKRVCIDEAPESRDDEVFDVLILGASVWHAHFGDLAPRFQAALENRLERRVRIWNIAEPGRTSLDSRLRYRHLANKRFDLVVFYHAINDCYMNNIPTHLYRPDYRHAARFDQIAMLTEHPEHTYFVLPYTIRFSISRILSSRLLREWKVSREPGPQHAESGKEVKTAEAFEANLNDILGEAKRRGDQVLLMTFALHIPTNYTDEAFAAKQLDYGRHESPLKLWGTKETVPAVVSSHNTVIRHLVAQHPEVLFVDQEQGMPRGKRYFDDPCHLSTSGCEAFVERMMSQVDWGRWTNREQSRSEP